MLDTRWGTYQAYESNEARKERILRRYKEKVSELKIDGRSYKVSIEAL